LARSGQERSHGYYAYGFRGKFCSAEFNGARTVVFCALSFKRFEILSISLVNPANILITRSFPITSDILRPPSEPPGEPSLSLEGGTRMLGIFIIGCCRSESNLAGALRNRFGKTSWDRAAGTSARERSRLGVGDFMA